MAFTRYRRLDAQARWTLAVVGPWFLALLAALGNHCIFVSLNDNDSSRYNQFWISVLKNSWALVVHALLASSANTAFSSMIWTSLPGHNIPVKSLDALFELPALVPALQIIFSQSIKFLYYPVYWSGCLATFVFITITPPSALTIQPMQGIPADIQAPALDLAADPGLYTIIRNNWEYVRPSNHIRRYMRNVLTSDAIFAWEAPSECRYGCTYNVTYYAPALRCVDYTPGDQSGLALNETYHGQFNISDANLTFNLTAWPVSEGTRRIDGQDTAPVGTRCTFHNATYTTKNTFRRNLQRAVVTNRTILPHSPLVGIPLGFANTSCPFNASWAISNPLDAPPCARIQLNTWALIDAFANSLSGTILVYPQTLGPSTRFANNALMPNLDYLFTVDELSRSFDLAPWVKQGGLGNALEAIFANATLSLTRDAQAYNWTLVTSDAKVVPFVNRYVYQPGQLWLGHASALVTALGAGWAGWVARKTGKVPMGESGLSRVLATTRDSSFEWIGGIMAEEVDRVVVRYEASQAGSGFVVVSDSDGQKGSLEIEEISLLRKS